MSWREAFLVRFGTGAFTGITLGRWLRVLRENHFAVDRPYWGRAASITVASISNTLLAAWERWLYGRKVRNTKVDPPLFVLGVWRSGTTHLHNLLTKDDRFAYPNTYQVFFPHTYLTTERINAWLMAFLVPKKRPMDNVTFGIAEPQEEEFALCSITGRVKPMAWAFPRRSEEYGRYLTLRGASTDETAEWKSALLEFLRKLSFKHGKPLILKSPGHTGRIKLLLELFPDARFVHICRNPYDVYGSMRHWVRTGLPFWALQREDYRDAIDRTIGQYREVFDAYFEERGLIPKGRLHEMDFESLEADPIGQLRNMYEALSLPEFSHVEPALQQYLATIKEYKKNNLPELPADVRSRVASEWRRSFEEWGYPV
jgi:hypothetical protein